MTYLELINAVLVRLRENTITVAKFDSDPFYRVIAALVNDAKDTVESSWNWSALRDTDSIAVAQGDKEITLPASTEAHYHISSILVQDTGSYLGWQTDPWIREKYRNNAVTPVSEGVPTSYGFGPTDATTGSQTITIYPPANQAYTFDVYRTKKQDRLTAQDDRLLVPALPVYALATALAARERGEVGGTPPTELFGLASQFLSDAIANDSDRFPEEMEWYANDMWHNTNVGTA